MRRRARRMVTCPWCGQEIPATRSGCPACGSDAETGWKDPEDLLADSVDLTSAEFKDDEYEEYLEREFGKSGGGAAWDSRRVIVALIVFLLVAALVLWVVL